MSTSFLDIVDSITIARQAWASSSELRQHFGGDVDRFLRYRLASIRPGDEAQQINNHAAELVLPHQSQA